MTAIREELSNYSDLIFHESFTKYLKIRRSESICESTLKNELRMHGYLRKFTKKDNPFDVTKSDIEKYAIHNQESGYSRNTCSIRIKGLRSFYNEAVFHEWTLINPLQNVKNPKRDEPLPTVLSESQVKSILSAPNLSRYKGVRDRAIMELMYSSGLRRSEVCNVTVNNFADDFRTIRLIGKGRKEAVIPVGRMAAHFCKYCSKYSVNDYLFISQKTCRPMDVENIAIIIKKYAKECDIKLNVSSHTFRYSIATHLSDHGADIRHIQEFLRHDSIDTTAGYIRHGIASLQKIHGKTHPRG